MAVRKHITNFFKDATKVPFCGTITRYYYSSADKTCVVEVKCEDGKIHMGMAVDYIGLIRMNPPNKTDVEYCFKQENGLPIAFCC